MGQSVILHQYRWHQRVASWFISILDKMGLSVCSLEPESIELAAKNKTGLNDIGEKECLKALSHLMSIAKEHRLSHLGKLMTRETCIKAMVNRLQLRHWENHHPDRFNPLQKPIFIVGLPRTGTTLLHNLISLDPKRRGLPFWEVLTPCPQDLNTKIDLRKRRGIGKSIVTGAYYMAPEQRFIHRVGVDTIEECWPILFNSYSVLNFDLAQGFDGWADWLLKECDMKQSYREYRRFLELCKGRTPEAELVLKCPEHLWFLDSLYHSFPDACVIWTHRNLENIMPSYASLVSLSQRTLSGQVQPEIVGQRLLPTVKEGIRRAFSFRKTTENNIFDTLYDDLCADPIAVIKQIYTHFDMEVTETHVELMKNWLNQKRTDGRGAHVYDPSYWGFDALDLASENREYFQELEGFRRPPAS